MKIRLLTLAFSVAIALAAAAPTLAETSADEVFARASALRDKGDFDGAIEMLSAWLKKNPQDPVAYNNRGSARRANGDLNGAIADFTRAIALSPQDAYAYFSRGVALYLQQSWLKASRDFDMASRQEKASDYGALLACVVQTRLGQGEVGRNALGLRLAARWDEEPGDWVAALSRFLLGTLDEAALLQASDSLDAQKARGQRCEAWYYAGMQRLAAGQKAEARRCFLECLATEQKGFIEYGLATAELKWLSER